MRCPCSSLTSGAVLLGRGRGWGGIGPVYNDDGDKDDGSGTPNSERPNKEHSFEVVETQEEQSNYFANLSSFGTSFRTTGTREVGVARESLHDLSLLSSF